MKKKISILTVILFCFVNLSIAQVIKLRTKTVNAQILLDNNIWSDWTQTIDISELVVLDLTKKRISIFTEENQVYDIIKVLDQEKFDNGNSTFSFKCIDQNGDFTDVSLIKEYENEILNKYLIVELRDKKIIYSLIDIN